MAVPDIRMVTSEYVIDVAAPDDDNVWVVCNFGFIFHSGDGGQTWQEQPSGVESMLTQVKFIDAQTGWVSGIKGVMLHTKDGGKTWTRQNTGTEDHLLAVSFVDAEYGWAVGDFSTILHTTDGGRSWTRQVYEREIPEDFDEFALDATDLIYTNVFFTDRENGWIIGEAGTILHTENGGADWRAVVPDYFEEIEAEEDDLGFDMPNPTLFGIHFNNRMEGWLCGLDSLIFHTTDGGETWNVTQKEELQPLLNIFVKEDRGWAVGDQGTYYLSRDGGNTWTFMEEAIKTKLSFSNVYFSSPMNGWIVGASGTIVRTVDGGETWQFVSGLSYEFEGFQMPRALEERVIE